MTYAVNHTHDPALASWVETANDANTDFPVQNLPYGVFTRRDADESPRVGVAIGAMVFDVTAAVRGNALPRDTATERCARTTLNGLMELPAAELSAFRARLSDALSSSGDVATWPAARRAELLVPMAEAELHLPAAVGDYTDFYASVFHATNVGRMFRPDSPLLPNYKYVPIGYHGRASSLVVGGTAVRRPRGQLKAPAVDEPSYAPTRLLDYEAEIGMFIGSGNALGEPVPIDEAEDHLFGLCLVNDWSARDVQAWEYQPLGPFLAKSFATTVGPWVVTLEALAPFRAPALARPAGDPEPLPYLHSDRDQKRGGVAVRVSTLLSTARMREIGSPPARVSEASFTDMYWTPAQLVAHHASNGCNLRPGDLLASGTVSGESKDSRGCLLELTSRGAEPLTLPNGETRTFLQDGDEVIMRGRCEATGARAIGFGDCRGVVTSASGEPTRSQRQNAK